jgi:hypothetical protein
MSIGRLTIMRAGLTPGKFVEVYPALVRISLLGGRIRIFWGAV